MDFASTRRRVIDQVATLRARAIRAALAGHLIYSKSCDTSGGQLTHDSMITLLQEQVDAMRQVQSMLAGKSADTSIQPDILEWLSNLAIQHKRVRRDVEAMHKLTQDMLNCAQRRASPKDEYDTLLSDVWMRHLTFSRGQFFETISNFCDSLWNDIENDRRDEVQYAAEASKAISETLVRLERIGKHVKLVSLNAAVEASRAGDAGKGLTVIAVEFKSLAEEIQSLAAHARTKIKAQ